MAWMGPAVNHSPSSNIARMVLWRCMRSRIRLISDAVIAFVLIDHLWIDGLCCNSAAWRAWRALNGQCVISRSERLSVYRHRRALREKASRAASPSLESCCFFDLVRDLWNGGQYARCRDG